MKKKTQVIPYIKKYSPKRWVVERTSPGITDSENCLLVMRKSQITILGWYTSPAA